MRVKKVLKYAGIINTALVPIGWFCFATGILIPDPIIKIVLLAIARVLPKALYVIN